MQDDIYLLPYPMFKRIFLFVLTNLAIILVLNIVLFIVFSVFDIRIQDAWLNYVSLAIFAIVYGFVGAFISLKMSKWIAKRAYPMKIITDADTHDPKIGVVRQTVVHIAQTENIKMPEIGIYQAKDPNAFATWPSKNNSLVGVSTALLEQMNDEEIRGVIAHEMAHIINGDMVTMTLLQGIINAFVIFFARVLAFALDTALSKGRDGAWLGRMWYFAVVIVLDMILGFVGMLVLMSYSRKREYAADAGSASYVGKNAMIAALRRLQIITQWSKVPQDELATLKIAGGKSWMKLLSSHPSLEDRIMHLEMS